MVRTLEKIMGQELPRMKMDDFDYEVKPHRNQTSRGTYPQKNGSHPEKSGKNRFRRKNKPRNTRNTRK